MKHSCLGSVALLLACAAWTLEAADPAVPPVKFGKLTATVPGDWKSEKPKFRLRSHQFRIPSQMEGLADIEITVNPEARPDSSRYFPQWKGQFTPPEGKTLDDVTRVSEFSVNGAKVSILDISGTWRYKDFPMAKKEEERRDFRVVWALVVVGDEASYVRMSGPESLVATHYQVFEKFLKGLK